MFGGSSVAGIGQVGGSRKGASSWWNDGDIKTRVETSMTPLMLAHAANRGSPLFASSGAGSASSAPTANAQHHTPNPNNNRRLAPGGVAAIAGANRPVSASAMAYNDLVSDSWREPFQALKRLVDRHHMEQLQKREEANATTRRGTNDDRGGGAGHVRRIGAMSAESRQASLLQRQQQMRAHAAANQHGSPTSGGGSPRWRLDPFTQMDQLYSKAKRKWIDLCVQMQVPEAERLAVEQRIAQRDDPQQMNNALMILHGEIERLVDLFKWTGELRRAIENREQKLAACCGFATQYAGVVASHHETASSENKRTTYNSMSRGGGHEQQGQNAEIILPDAPDNAGDICVRMLQRLLDLRHASADVYTAHRKWQTAQGSTSPVPLFVYRGTAYLEKMLQDLTSVVDTDAVDVDQAIQQQRQSLGGQTTTATSSGGSSPSSSRPGSASASHRSAAAGSALAVARSSKSGIGGRSLSPSSHHSRLGGSASPTRHHYNHQHHNHHNHHSKHRGGGGGGGTTSPTSMHHSVALFKLPTWLFGLVTFRVSRANVLLDTRKRRVVNADKQSQDFVSRHNEVRERMMAAADENLDALVSERCGWSIDDYFHSGSNAFAEVRVAWKYAAEVLRKRAQQTCTDPAELGTVHSEFLKELSQGCSFVLEHEAQIVDRLVQRSMNAATAQGNIAAAAAASGSGGGMPLSPLDGIVSEASAALFMMSNSIKQPQNILQIISAQAYARRYLARRQVRRMWEERVAATMIQSRVYRAWKARIAVRTMRLEWRAARSIQAFYRGCRARHRIRQDLARRRAEAQRKEQEYLAVQRAKPDPSRIVVVADRTLIVSPSRKMLQEGRRRSADGKQKTLRECLTEAVVKIQAAFRGYRVYNMLDGVSGGGGGRSVRQWRMVLRINAAAAKIQALVRGVLTRREHLMTQCLLFDVKILQRAGRGFMSRRRGLLGER